MKVKRLAFLIMILLASSVLVQSALAEASIPQQDRTPLAPLAKPNSPPAKPRYISGFGLNNAYTIFYEDRVAPGCTANYPIYFNQTSSGPLGFAATSTATDICDSHVLVKNWAITIGATTYAYRAWGAGNYSGSHNFYVSNNLVNWTLVAPFTFDHPSDGILYGFHDIIQLNGHYIGFVESAGGHTYIVSSPTGDQNWTVVAKVGGSDVSDAPLNLSFTSDGPIPTGDFLRMEVGGQIVYGKLMVPGNHSGAYMAINRAAAQAATPAAAEAAFLDPTNWTWADSSTGLPGPGNRVLTSTLGAGGHDIHETWTIPASNPLSDNVILYTANYASLLDAPGIGFAAHTYSLTYTVNGHGAITAPASSPSSYDSGEVVTITADADPGSHFVNWSGDVSTVVDATAASTSITMNGNYAIVANFAGLPVITEGASVLVTMSRNGAPTPFGLTLHATDAEGDTITWSISTAASHGTASASGTGTSKAVGYTPNSDYIGADSFVVQVSDGHGGTDSITVNVTISATNDPPVITEGTSVLVYMSVNGAPTPFGLTLDATDANGDTITWSISTAASHGTASATGTGTSKAIGYAPTHNYIGSDSFVVRVSDGHGGTDSITVHVTILAHTAPTFTSSPSYWNYGLIKVTTTSSGRVFKITNTGSASMIFGTVTLVGINATQFHVTADACSGQTLNPSDTCMITATFAPTTAGAKTASMRFPDNTAAHLHYVQLVGKGAIEQALNGGFNTYPTATSRVPMNWTAANFSATDGKDTATKKEGAASVKIANSSALTKTLTETRAISGAAGNAFLLSLWGRGLNIPATAGVVRARVFLYSASVLKQTAIITFPNGTYGFTQKTLVFAATSSYNKVVIQLVYSKGFGAVRFDGLSLLRSP